MHSSEDRVDAVWGLWREIGVTRLQYRLASPVEPLQAMQLSRNLQGQLWRRHCDASNSKPCKDRGIACQLPDRCIAEKAFPLSKVGTSNFRMASVFLRWPDQRTSFDALLLDASDKDVSHVEQALRFCGSGIAKPTVRAFARLGDLCPPGTGTLKVATATPIVLGKANGNGALDLAAEFPFRLKDSMLHRGYKLSAYAVRRAAIAGQLSKADQIRICQETLVAGRLALAAGVRILSCPMNVETIELPSESSENKGPARYRTAQGQFVLEVHASAWPWVALMQLCGVGENADEGWGSVTARWLPEIPA